MNHSIVVRIEWAEDKVITEDMIESALNTKLVLTNEAVSVTELPQEKEAEREEIRRLRIDNAKLREATENLIFTASKLWDEVKPIKDTHAITVTHPMIEEAKVAISQSELLEKEAEPQLPEEQLPEEWDETLRIVIGEHHAGEYIASLIYRQNAIIRFLRAKEVKR